jgi:indole-3-acetate monooxygenase
MDRREIAIDEERDQRSAAALARIRALAPEIAAAAEAIERERQLPEPLVARLHEAQAFRMLLPRSYGGAEVDPLTFVQAIESVARQDASAAWVLCQTSVCGMSAAYLEPAVLAWGSGFNGKAVPVAGGYRVTGEWHFASGSRHATWIGGHSLLCDAAGAELRHEQGAPVTRTMLFPRGSVSVRDSWNVMGLRGTGSDAYRVVDCFVPAAHSLGRDDPADRRSDGPLYRLKTDTLYSSGFAALALGLARGLVDALRELAVKKTPRGYANTLRNSALFQTEYGEMEARLRAARAYLLGSLGELWQGVLANGALTLDQRMAMRLAATHAMREAKQVAEAAYHGAGATAIFTGNEFERRWRDMNAVSQQLQARRAHIETVGKHLLGLEADTTSL